MDKNLFFYELEGRGYIFQNKKWDEAKHGFEDDMLNMAWEMWASAKHGLKAQAVPEGFVLVPKEPYAYLIKHKLWNKNSQPEIYLADDFVGDDGVEREKLIVCIPLYKGEDEAQEQSHD